MRRDARLPGGAPFERTYREGTVIHGPLFVLRALRTDAPATRWGFAVGKRLDKRAVVRNQVRRRLRAAADALQPADGWDLVVTAKRPALAASVREFETALRRAARKFEQLR